MLKKIIALFHFIFYLFPIGIKANQQIKECLLSTPIAHSVDLFQGTWIETAIDLSVPGLQPLQREYTCQERDLASYAQGWNFSYPNIGQQGKKRKKFLDLVDLHYDEMKRLIRIQKKDHNNHLLPYWLTFEYQSHRWTVKTSQSDEIHYDFSPSTLKGFKLDRVTQGKKVIEYSYLQHPKERRLLISERRENQGVWLKMHYNSQGKLSSLHRSLDQGHTYTEICQIDYEENQAIVKTALGASFVYRFNENGHPLEISTFKEDKLYRQEEFQYHEGYLSYRAIKDSAGAILKAYRCSYDHQGNLLSETLYGTLTHHRQLNESYSKYYQYNSHNQVIKESEDNKTIIELKYDEKNRLITRSFKKDQIVYKQEFYSYDQQDRLVEIVTDYFSDPIKRFIVRYENFHPLGMPQTTISGKWDFEKNQLVEEKVENHSYTTEGRLISEIKTIEEDCLKIEINGSSESRCHLGPDKQPLLQQEFHKGRLKEEIWFHYDSNGLLIDKVNHAGQKTCYIYDFLGRKIKEIFPTQEWIEYTYDPLDRIIEVRNSDGCIDSLTYNARSQILQVFQNDILKEEKQYNLDGTLIKNTYQNGTFSAYENRLNETQDISEQDLENPTASETYVEWILTENGELLKEETWIHPIGSKIKKRYDFLDRVCEARIESAQGELFFKTTYQYNLKGLKKKEQRYQRDSDGKMKLRLKRQWDYSCCGELLRYIENDQKITHYTYDHLGQLSSIQQPSGIAILYDYDTNGRLNQIEASDHSVSYKISYDSEGRVCSVENPNFKQTRLYNPSGQLIQENLGHDINMRYEYNQDGRKKKIFFPDNTGAEYVYQDDQLKTINRFKNESLAYSCHYLAYDEDGHPLLLQLPEGLGEIAWSWNEKGRLKKISAPYFHQTAQFDSHQRYEKILTEDPKGCYEDKFSYDELGHLMGSHLENHLVEYDLNGNLILYDQWHLTYDAFNRLAKVSKSREIIHEYQYDLYHRRLVDLVNDEYYFYEGNWELGSIKDQKIQALRIFGFSHSLDHGPCIAMEFQNKLYAPLYDMQGSVKVLLSAETKLPEESYRYSPYGECQVFSSHSSINPWRYSNKRFDFLTGLIHFERRDYLPTLHQFLTPDPLNDLEGSDPYQYTQGDPINYRDLLGLKTTQTSFFQEIKNKTLKRLLSLKDYANLDFHGLLEYMTGHIPLMLLGYNYTKALSGVYGEGEINPKVRISFMNGILTDYSTLHTTLKYLSESHGGSHIHFVYRPTNGWVLDIGHSIFVRLGWTSSEAKLLAESWKLMIAEMGGVEGGGKIIHYAHSIGTLETFRALELLTLEEQAMIEVFAFGSPSLSNGAAHWNVHHFVSVRDGVSLLDSVQFIKACLGYSPHVTFVGSFWGIPLVDHYFLNQVYQDLWRAMGRTFVETYG